MPLTRPLLFVFCERVMIFVTVYIMHEHTVHVNLCKIRDIFECTRSTKDNGFLGWYQEKMFISDFSEPQTVMDPELNLGKKNKLFDCYYYLK